MAAQMDEHVQMQFGAKNHALKATLAFGRTSITGRYLYCSGCRQ